MLAADNRSIAETLFRVAAQPPNDYHDYWATHFITTTHAADPLGIPIISTKLAIPAPGADQIARPRLLEQLDQRGHRAVTLVVAPAGYGKTALLGAWAQQSAIPIAWLALDPSDSEPHRFWAYLIAALDTAQPGIGGQIGALLGLAPASIEQVLAALINALAMAAPMTLVLDNYHTITAELVHQSLTYLLDHLPPTLQVVLAGRGEPPLPLARWRLADMLHELSSADLCFDHAEAAHLLAETQSLPITPNIVAALVERTEGWAAGLRLAARLAHSSGGLVGSLYSFGGGHRDMQDYFDEEVLAQLAPDLRTFLLRSAVLDRLCAPLCAALCAHSEHGDPPAGPHTAGLGSERDHAGALQAAHNLLAQSERAGLFLIPLDSERRWYRYHTLFAEALRCRLEQENPALAAWLRERAAAWPAEHSAELRAPAAAMAPPERLPNANEQSDPSPAADPAHEMILSKRELDVLNLLSDGCSNQDIAARLIIGVNTVKMHIKHLYNKLDAHNRTQAVARARRLGLV
jgi:LuxR family maltose regulon positive regulatory protein